MNNKDKNANYKPAPNMYDYLLNTNINNITKKDIDYLKSLFSSVSLADRTSKRVRRASKALFVASILTYGIGTLVTKGDATWLEAFRYSSSFFFGTSLGFTISRQIRVNRALKGYGLTEAEYLSLKNKGKIKEFEEIIKEFNIALRENKLLTINNEPFPDFAYTPADRKNEFLRGLYSLAFQLHKSMGKSADTFEFQVYLRPYDSEKTKSKDNNNNNDSSNEPEN